MKNIKVIIHLLVIYSLVIGAQAMGVTLPKTAEMVPAETVFIADIADFNQFRVKFEKSSIYRLYKDPSMAAFVENFKSKINEKLSKEDNPFIVANGGIFDANSMPQGRLAFVFVLPANAEPQQEPVFLMISQWGSNLGLTKEKIDKIIAKSIEKGAQRSIEQYRDVNLIILTTERPAEKVSEWDEDSNASLTKTIQPPPDKDVYCFIDDCLITGNDVETVKFVVAHIKGASGANLSADSDYSSVMGETGPYRDLNLFVNFKQFLKKMAAADKTGRDSMEMANLGLDGLVGIGCSLGINTADRGNLIGKVFIKTSGVRKGVLKMLEMRSEQIKAPKFIPASAYSVSFFNIDIRRAYDEFCSIMYSFEPASAAALQMPLVQAGANGEPAITLRKDIIEYLGSQIIVSQTINKPFEKGVAPAETMIAVAINNRADLEKSLSLVHKKLIVPLNPDPTKELLGHTIYLLGPQGIPIFGGAVPMADTVPGKTIPKGPRLAFTITDTHLIMGQEPAVDRAIRTLAGAQAEAIGSAEWFNNAKSTVPSVVGLAGLENTVASGELLWWMLKQSAKNRRADLGMGPAAAVMAGPDFWNFGDFGLLPEFDSVKKYFGYSAFYGVSRPDGFLLN